MASRRLDWVVDIKGFLALYVLLHHAVSNIDTSGEQDGLWAVLHGLFGHGQFRVDIFFVLSGYCLALSLRGAPQIPDFRQFLLRRSLRLLPPYFAGLGLSLLAIALWLAEPSGTHWDFSLPVTTGGVITHVLMIHNWWQDYATTINHPYWSIGVEYQLYFLFPVLLWLHHRLGHWKSWVLMTIVSYVVWRVLIKLGVGNAASYGASPYYWALFSMGIAAAKLGEQTEPSPNKNWMDLLAAGSVIFLMACWWLFECVRYHGHVADPITSFFIGIMSLWVLLYGRQAGLFKLADKLAPRKLLRFVGERSYSLYLVHGPLLQVTWLGLVHRLHIHSAGRQALLVMTAGTALSLCVSELFFRLIERPCHEWGRRISQRNIQKAFMSPAI